MAVTRSCNPDKRTVTLNIGAGEHIIYEVKARGQRPLFTLVDQHGRILLSDTDPPVGAGHYRRKWPDGDQVQAPDDLNHVLGILFLAAVEYEFIVSECDAGGNLISLRKHCTYKSTTATDKFFDPVRVFTI